MTDQTERYDRIAKGYDRWWAPVLALSAAALLDRMAPVLEGKVVDLLDVGVGTGNLALAAVERWPDVRVMGVDASGEMVRVVRSLATERLLGRDGDRFQAQVAFAAEMPFEDAAFDAAMSSFVLQLVPSRPKALREVRRVLRPGATFAYVTWLRDNRPFAPDRIFDELLAEFGFDEEEDDRRSGDLPTVARAAAELRRAGFRDVAAEGALLEHTFTVDGYIGFLVEFDEESLFEEMARSERRRFLARFRERLMALSQDQLTFRVPIVYASGRRGPA
ncbi:MAG: class I SAM-dependent methyltransferase [Chloroflexota bacterium]